MHLVKVKPNHIIFHCSKFQQLPPWRSLFKEQILADLFNGMQYEKLIKLAIFIKGSNVDTKYHTTHISFFNHSLETTFWTQTKSSRPRIQTSKQCGHRLVLCPQYEPQHADHSDTKLCIGIPVLYWRSLMPYMRSVVL